MSRKRKLTSPEVNDRRDYVLRLLNAGLILQNEAAELAGVTRQRVYQWVKVGNYHPSVARRRYLKTLMHDHR